MRDGVSHTIEQAAMTLTRGGHARWRFASPFQAIFGKIDMRVCQIGKALGILFRESDLVDRKGNTIAKPHELTRAFEQLPPNIELLDKLWHKYRSEYIRTRLRAIRLLWQGYTRQEVIETLTIGQTTMVRWMRLLVEQGVEAGLRQLASPKKAPKSGKLSYEQQATLIAIIEQKKPTDYGFEQSILSGDILVKIVEQEWQITVSDQTIYTILQRNKISYQRGHRDYEPADPTEQHSYAERLKKSSKRQKTAKRSSSLMNSGSLTDQPSSMAGHG